MNYGIKSYQAHSKLLSGAFFLVIHVMTGWEPWHELEGGYCQP